MQVIALDGPQGAQVWRGAAFEDCPSFEELDMPPSPPAAAPSRLVCHWRRCPQLSSEMTPATGAGMPCFVSSLRWAALGGDGWKGTGGFIRPRPVLAA